MKLAREAMREYQRKRRSKLYGPSKSEIYERLVIVEEKLNKLLEGENIAHPPDR